MSQYMIKVDESEFGKSYTAMKAAADDINTLINQFSTANDSLAAAWAGQGGNAFAAVTEKMEADFALLKKGLDRLTQELNESYETFAAMDDVLSKMKIGQIPGFSKTPDSAPTT